MRIASALLSILCVLGACGRAPKAPPRATGRPSILLVSIDTLRADHLGCYGYDPYDDPVTPAIDALADVARHLHSFNAMTDLLLIADACFVVSRVAARGRVQPPVVVQPASAQTRRVARSDGYGRSNVRTRNAAISPRVFELEGQ